MANLVHQFATLGQPLAPLAQKSSCQECQYLLHCALDAARRCGSVLLDGNGHYTVGRILAGNAAKLVDPGIAAAELGIADGTAERAARQQVRR